MDSLLTLAASHPSRALAAGEMLITQGTEGGDLFILESGQLLVERDGVRIATIATPSSLIGEMSVVLGTASSATVKAEKPTTVRVIHDAQRQALVQVRAHVAHRAKRRIRPAKQLGHVRERKDNQRLQHQPPFVLMERVGNACH